MPDQPGAMRRIALLAATLAVCAGTRGMAATPAHAPRLLSSAALAHGIDAFPRLAAPAGDRTAQRINRALDRADARMRSAAKSCLASSGPAAGDKPSWNRSVSVTMRGPRYLSLIAADDFYCGGAYPDTGRLALVYDLETGAPVNWAHLLPPLLTQKPGTDTAEDGTIIGTLSSPALKALYVRAAARQESPDDGCAQVLADPGNGLSFILWPDAEEDGLAVLPFGLPHAVAACGPDIVIPTAALRKLGANPRLLDAIDTAHREGLYGQPAR